MYVNFTWCITPEQPISPQELAGGLFVSNYGTKVVEIHCLQVECSMHIRSTGGVNVVVGREQMRLPLLAGDEGRGGEETGGDPDPREHGRDVESGDEAVADAVKEQDGGDCPRSEK